MDDSARNEFDYDIALIGNSISANLAAGYLSKKLPQLRIGVIGPEDNNHPIVGESLTEFSTNLLHEIGLSSYLEESHYHKYGLTFYFKEDISNHRCRRYAAHEALAIPPLPSNQINRFTFDRDLRSLNRKRSVTYILDKVTSVDRCKSEGFRLMLRKDRSERKGVTARFVIDCSGRNRFLTKAFKLDKPVPFQRSTFWFRLANFDREKLFDFDGEKPEQIAFDSYFATHHFMGRANWIWLIPMRSEHENMLSIGIVYRPDLFEGEIRSMDDFLSQMETEHPHLAELVRSGEVIDTNIYRNYMYDNTQLYHPDGWFILGDAGAAVDPLYSTGMVMTSLQITQITNLIGRQLFQSEREHRSVASLYRDFEETYRQTRDNIQLEIGTYYEVTHDPFQAHWRMHLISAYYFYFLLPAWLAGYISDPVGNRYLLKVMRSEATNYLSLLSLLPKASKALGGSSLDHITNKYGKTVNWDLWTPREREMPYYLSRVLLLYVRYRFRLLRLAGWQDAPTHLACMIRDIYRAGFIRIALFRATLRSHPLIRWWVKDIPDPLPFPSGDHPLSDQTPRDEASQSPYQQAA